MTWMLDMAACRSTLLVVIVCIPFVSGCGGKQGGAGADAMTLLKAGRCEEVLSVAVPSSEMDPQTRRAVIGFCMTVLHSEKASAVKAVRVLREQLGEMHAAASAREMLDAASVFPETLSSATSQALAEVALGAAGYGPFAPSDAIPTESVGAATRALAVSVLERLAASLEGENVRLDAGALLVTWNSCFSLMGGTFEMEEAHQAWRLYMAVAHIAIFAGAEASDADITEALLGALVTVVEVNPAIQPAVRCDLASPYDEIKNALLYRRSLAARLEKAVKGAVGCTRGTYAP